MPGARKRPLIHAFLLALIGLLVLAPSAWAIQLTPDSPHSPNAEDQETAYVVMLIVAVLLTVGINAALIAAVVRFRARRGEVPARTRAGRHVEARAAGGFGLLAVAILALGIVFTERSLDVEASGPEGLRATGEAGAQAEGEAPEAGAEPLVIRAIGQQWLWRYEYPGGRPGAQTFSYENLVVPVDTTVIVELDSVDVVHRWWVPALGGKFDAVPGSPNSTWFKADEEGVYEGRSTQFSGPGYSTMGTKVTVLSVPEFEEWLRRQEADLAAAQGIVEREVGARAGAERAAEEVVE